MSKLNSRIPKYRLHKSSGQAVVTLGGRDFLLGTHNSKASKAKYDRLIGEWLLQDRQAALAPEACLTMVELVARYWAFAKEKYKRSGNEKTVPALIHIRTATRYLLSLYEDLPADQFGPLQLKVVRKAMLDKSGWSRNYINAQVARLVRMAKWAVGEGLLPAANHAALALVEGLRRNETEARETARIKPVDDATIEATLPHLPAVVSDMVSLQRLTGMRPSGSLFVETGRFGPLW